MMSALSTSPMLGIKPSEALPKIMEEAKACVKKLAASMNKAAADPPTPAAPADEKPADEPK